MQTNEFLKEMQKYVKQQIDKNRYKHSLRVAETAALLCERYGENPDAGYFAGLVHDMCKQWSDRKNQELAEKDGFYIAQIEKQKPSLLHGRAAAVLLEERFAKASELAERFVKTSGLIEAREEIIEAVRWHTFGNENLSNLAKIVYVADKIEPGRSYDAKELLKESEVLSLDELALKVIKDMIAYLKRTDKEISFLTLRFYEELLSKIFIDNANKK